jgi:phosphoribosylformylglycinamidine synthase
VRSAAVPALGGLALVLARCAMAGRTGLDLDLAACPDLAALPPDVALFAESAGRFVVTVAPEDAPRFVAGFDGLACSGLGRVTAEARLRVRGTAGPLLDVDVASLAAAFKETLADE